MELSSKSYIEIGKMSIITLQFGQCGNQIGRVFFNDLYNDVKSDGSKISKRSHSDYFTEATNKWFNVNKYGKLEARSILIDTETKVSCSSDNTLYKCKNIVAKSHGGSANNWAYGYSSKSLMLMNDITESIRKEMEKCDTVASIFSILSCAGGTGSGVGSKTIEVLRDMYPNKNIINAIVLPYSAGEVVTQNYNSLLTLAKVYDITNMTYLYENDSVHHTCSKSLSLANVNFSDLNSLIAQQLASALQPVGNMSVSQIVSTLASHPSYKFVQIKSVPHVPKEHVKFEGPSTWIVLINRLKNILKLTHGNHNKSKVKLKCASNILVSRGCTPPTEEDLKPIEDNTMYVPWVPNQYQFLHYHQSRSFKDLNKFLTLSTNNNSVYFPINIILEDFWTMFSKGAFVHHYKKFDVDEDYFLAAFEKLEKILHDYGKM